MIFGAGAMTLPTGMVSEVQRKDLSTLHKTMENAQDMTGQLDNAEASAGNAHTSWPLSTPAQNSTSTMSAKIRMET